MTLTIANHSNVSMSLDVEPYPDQYSIEPGMEVQVMTEMRDDGLRKEFALHWHPNGIALFPPDDADDWEGTKVICDGVVMVPK